MFVKDDKIFPKKKNVVTKSIEIPQALKNKG